MILSNVEIQRAIDDGDIVLQPEPLPRHPTLSQPKCPYDTTAVNLRLSPNLSVPQPRAPFCFDLKGGPIGPFLSKVYDPVTIGTGGYSLAPGQFVLGNTVEYIHLPIRPSRPVYAARVEGRSSYARCGLVVHLTAPTIHADFRGHITLEIKNLGEHPIMLRAGEYIAQLIFERVSGTPILNPSQFSGQTTPTGDR